MKVSVVLLILSVVSAGPVWACSYDGQFNNPFTESYPGSLNVVIATQTAHSSSALSKPDKVEGAAGLQRVVWWLKLFVKANGSNLPDNLNIYIADSHLWSKVSNLSTVVTHTTTPIHSENVLVISESALSNVVSNNITYEQSLEMGVALLR